MNRVIIFGRIDYKNCRSANFARTEYIRHSETKAKGDLIFSPIALFGEDLEVETEALEIEFERGIHEAGDKTLQNSLNALDVLLQYAIAGRVDLFVIEPGEPPHQLVRVVHNDKSTVHAYEAGVEAVTEKRDADSIAPFREAIRSHKRHAWAMDQLGDVYFRLEDFDAAETAYKDARQAYPAMPNPHLGLAKIAHSRNQRAATIDNLELAMKGAIPHQPGYWICALFKAEVLLDLVERGATTSPEEHNSYMANANTLLDRYAAKLRQLGKSRNEYYPAPAELDRLRERYADINESEHADA